MATFRLQSLLNYRHQLEEQEMLRLATVEAERREAQELLDELCRRREEQCGVLDRLAKAQPLDAYRMRGAVEYLGLVEEAITRQVSARAEVDARVAAQRELLVTAARDRQALERLRERQAVETRREVERVEARRADEIAMARYGRFGIEGVGEGI